MKHEYLTIINAKIGDKVALVNPPLSYHINRANPVICSIYFCYGVVKNISTYKISVIWDNGVKNVYNDNELALVNDRIVNENGRYTSIWQKRIP